MRTDRGPGLPGRAPASDRVAATVPVAPFVQGGLGEVERGAPPLEAEPAYGPAVDRDLGGEHAQLLDPAVGVVGDGKNVPVLDGDGTQAGTGGALLFPRAVPAAGRAPLGQRPAGPDGHLLAAPVASEIGDDTTRHDATRHDATRRTQTATLSTDPVASFRSLSWRYAI